MAQDHYVADTLAAVADASALSLVDARNTRYLTFATIPDQVRKDFESSVTVHLWGLSKRSDPPKLRWVSKNLAAINLDDFGIDRNVYGGLKDRDPYHHTKINGLKNQVLTFAMPTAEAAKLGDLTYSYVPLLRADWFLAETSIQEGRKGTGYYDFLGVKNRADFFKLAGLDVKTAQARGAEHSIIIRKSGVARYPRQIVRLGATDGGYWFTRDSLDSTKGDQNAIDNLGKEFKHQAEEHYAFSPAGVPIYLLCDAEGNLQNSAPDKIGRDHTRPGQDQRIEINMSCIRCHKEVLRPFESFLAHNAKDPFQAVIPFEKKQVFSSYFRDPTFRLKNDAAIFADAIRKANGLTPEANAKSYARAWDWYNEDGVTLGQAAVELGSTREKLSGVLADAAALQLLRPTLIRFLAGDDSTIHREHFEEAFQLLLAMTRLPREQWKTNGVGQQ